MNKAFEKILEMLEEETNCPNCSMYCADANICGFEEMQKQAISIVKEVAKEYNGDWIPCSERLPDIKDFPQQKYRVLVSCTDGIVRNTTIKSLLENETHYACNHEPFTYEAWQALPFPYLEKH